jgi:hypothetical protein
VVAELRSSGYGLSALAAYLDGDAYGRYLLELLHIGW